MSNTIKATARVQVTLEFAAPSPWGDECSIGQLYKQATDDGLAQIRKLVAESRLQVRIIGDPKVIGIITEGDR